VQCKWIQVPVSFVKVLLVLQTWDCTFML
jgi:hypothetical protein